MTSSSRGVRRGSLSRAGNGIRGTVSPAPRADDHAVLATALDHVWRWYELRHVQGIQSVNYFMLASAILSAGYVSALSNKLYMVAGIIGVIGAIVSALAFMSGRRLRQIGMIAEAPMAILQDRLATELNLDELRMLVNLRQGGRRRRALNVTARRIYFSAATVALLLGLAGAFYAWFGH